MQGCLLVLVGGSKSLRDNPPSSGGLPVETMTRCQADRLECLKKEQRMKHIYQIGVTLGLSNMRVVSLAAENANEAVIVGLSLLGLVSLEMVTGITIREMDL